MRKLLFLAVALCLSFATDAQVRSLGLTRGPFEGIAMQHGVYGTENVFQLDLGYHTGVPSAGSVRLSGSYNIMIWSPEWTDEGNWNIYAGPGAYVGGGWAPGKGLTFGVFAVAGLEYLFEGFPLQLCADLRPTFGTVLTNDDFVFDLDGLLGFVPSVSVRYMF